jgi:hypothetical protein
MRWLKKLGWLWQWLTLGRKPHSLTEFFRKRK